MIIIGPLIYVLSLAIRIYMWAVIISAVLSWLVAFNVINTTNRVVYMFWDFLHRVTEPALRPIRRVMPNLGGVDVSPVILILILIFCELVLANLSLSIGSAGY